MAKIRVDSCGIAEIHTIMDQQTQTMQRIEQTISRILMNLDMQIAATESIRQSLTALKNSSVKEAELFSSMSSALIRVNDDFTSTDHGLSEQARDVNYALDYIIADAADGFKSSILLETMMKLLETESLSMLFGLSTAPVLPLNLQLLFSDTTWEHLESLNNVSSGIKNAGDYAEWLQLLFNNDEFGEISDVLDEVGKNDFFKVAGYLGDGKKLVDALNNGDTDKLEGLIEKYSKKGVKSGIKLATGAKISGVVNSVYLDLGWNLGENTVESVQDFIDNPSIESAYNGIKNITAGTFFDAGTGLAENVLSFVGDVTGQGFDSADFRNAMDYLWNHPIESAYATVEVIKDGVASFFDWLF